MVVDEIDNPFGQQRCGEAGRPAAMLIIPKALCPRRFANIASSSPPSHGKGLQRERPLLYTANRVPSHLLESNNRKIALGFSANCPIRLAPVGTLPGGAPLGGMRFAERIWSPYDSGRPPAIAVRSPTCDTYKPHPSVPP